MILNESQKEEKIMNPKNLKAQAALEFLTTYGWAFLVILIMIGTLAYFGILSPSKLLPNRCNMGTEFQCIDYRIIESGATSQVDLRLKNNVGEPITLPSSPAGISVGTETTANLACTTVTPALPITMKAGEVVDFVLGSCANMAAIGLIKGEKGKINISIVYHSVTSGSTYLKNVKGEILTTVT